MLSSIERTEPARTVIVPRVGPSPAHRRLRFLLPWLVFGAVAVAVVAGSTMWSVALRTSAAGWTTPDAAGIDTGAAPVVAPVPTTVAAVAPSEAATAPTFTPVRTPSPRPRPAASPPAPVTRFAEVSASASPPTVPTILSDPAACADLGVDPASCGDSAPALRAENRAATTATSPATSPSTPAA